MAVISGNGTTLTFGTTTTFTPKFTQIGGYGYSREAIEIRYLTQAGTAEYLHGKVFGISPFTNNFFLEPDVIGAGHACSIDDLLFDSGESSAAETTTVTYPDSGAATITGSAFVTEFNIEDIGVDGLIAASIGVQWSDAPTIAE